MAIKDMIGPGIGSSNVAFLITRGLDTGSIEEESGGWSIQYNPRKPRRRIDDEVEIMTALLELEF